MSDNGTAPVVEKVPLVVEEDRGWVARSPFDNPEEVPYATGEIVFPVSLTPRHFRQWQSATKEQEDDLGHSGGWRAAKALGKWDITGLPSDEFDDQDYRFIRWVADALNEYMFPFLIRTPWR